MDRAVGKRINNWVITIESSEDRHKQIIQSTVAERAYQIFEKRGCKHGFDLEDEKRGCKHGFDLEDWMSAQKELLHDDFDGNMSEFHFLLQRPRDPEVTTILSLTTHSLIVFRSHVRRVSEGDTGPDVLSVHVLPEEIDPAQANVKAVDGLLHVYMPKKNNHRRLS